MTAAAATLVGDDVAGDPEKPDTECGRTISVAGTCSLLEPMEVGKGGEERALGGVLGLVMVAELVIRVAVHLCEIPAIEGVEAGRVAARLLDERAIPVEMSDAGRAGLPCPSHPSEHRSSHPVTPPRRGERGGSRR